MFKSAGLVTLMSLVVGCGDSSDVDGTFGQLGEGVFRYGCVDDGDARCNETESVSSLETSASLGIDPELPTAVAVGARFDLTYVGDSIDAGEVILVDVEPARGELVTKAAGFVISVPGTFAFLARNGPKQRVVDFVHMDAQRAIALDVWHQKGVVTTLELTVAETSHLAVVPMAAGDIALAGAMAISWETSDANVVSVGSITAATSGAKELNEDEIRLVAEAAGIATITVTHGELTSEITVTVAEGV
jgi:hypothetical protein